MKKFWALTRVSFQAMLLGVNGGAARGRKRRVRTALGAAAIIALVGLYLSGLYSALLLKVLAPIRMEGLLFMFMGMAAVFSGVMYTAFSVKNTVYGGTDNDLLLSMPVSSTTLMLSRVAALYVESLLFTFFLMVPAGVACAILSQRGLGRDAGFWARMLLVVLTLPMLDTALSLLLGALLAWLSHKITKKAFGQTLLMGAYLAAIFWLSFNIQRYVEHLAVNAARVRAALNWLKPIAWMSDGIMGDWLALGRFALMGAIPFAAVVFVLGRLYRRAVTAFSSQSARSDYHLSAQRANGAMKALLLKDARHLFGSAAYFWNSTLGLVMLLALSLILLIRRHSMGDLMAMLELGDAAVLPVFVMGVMGFCLCTVNIAAPSISVEGKNLWILREAPLPEGQLLLGKLALQWALAVPVLAACLALLGLSGLFTAGQWGMLAAFALLFEIAQSCFGMLMGLRFARLDAPNEVYVVKQSMLTFLAMFIPMAVLAAGYGLGWLASRAGLGRDLPDAMMKAVTCVGALFAVISVLLLRARGAALLRRLGEG